MGFLDRMANLGKGWASSKRGGRDVLSEEQLKRELDQMPPVETIQDEVRRQQQSGTGTGTGTASAEAVARAEAALAAAKAAQAGESRGPVKKTLDRRPEGDEGDEGDGDAAGKGGELDASRPGPIKKTL